MSDGWHGRRAEPTEVPPEQSSGGSRAQRRKVARAAQVRRRRQTALGVVLLVFLLVVGVVLWTTRDSFFGPPKPDDYGSGEAGPEVVVHVTGTNNSDFAQPLVAAGVVKSVGAFNAAAGDKPIAAGYYQLPKKLPADEAVEKMVDPNRASRVGMLSVPAGAQLDDKGSGSKVAHGIFSALSAATAHNTDAGEKRIDAKAFSQVAATASVADLGVPTWAAPVVNRLKGDHRRIEGLIAPGVWEDIDPFGTPQSILKSLISKSADQYEARGLLDASRTSAAKLGPYEVLVSASVVEREVNQEQDYPKVARVILNRLAKDQMLQMDSTVNYTEIAPNINVAGEKLQKKTQWNTYSKYGLPITPVGAVGIPALLATESPAPGPWLYFVTVDDKGTTLFTSNFDEHERNRQKACDTKFLTVGCGG